MCYHQARSARFIGHCWGRGWGDATENLFQTAIINNRFGSLPRRRICDKKYNFYPSVRFISGGDSVEYGGGVEEQNKQTKHKLCADHSGGTTAEKVDLHHFFVHKIKSIQKTHTVYNRAQIDDKRSPLRRLIHSVDALHSFSSMIKNHRANFDNLLTFQQCPNHNCSNYCIATLK